MISIRIGTATAWRVYYAKLPPPPPRPTFDRIVTPRFTRDVDELRTYSMDIRQVLSDNAIRDMLAEEDHSTLRALQIVGFDSPAQPPSPRDDNIFRM